MLAQALEFDRGRAGVVYLLQLDCQRAQKGCQR